ncbi:MAG: hypothetical protein RJB38_1769 [Pseudomonadota bacterium]|jgi:putative peptidoglycan lipid II flippase
MGVATFLSRILGLVREQAFAFLFGAGHVVDAFTIAFRIPNLLRDLFAEGAMSAALVPTFTRVRQEQGVGRAWALARRVWWVLFLVVGGLSIFGIIFAEPLVRIYAGAFEAVPGKFELTVRLTRIMFPFFPAVALAAGFMAILNALGVFFMPAFASALFNIFSVFFGVGLTFLFARWGQEPILGMAVGVVIGGIVQAFCQWPSLRKKRSEELGSASTSEDRGRLTQDQDLKRMLQLMVPGTLGLAATQINLLVNSVLATSAGPGAVSWLSYSFRLMQFPIGVFGVSMAQATLPRVSAQWAQKDPSGALRTLERSLVQTFAINLPAAAGLAFLADPIIRLIFEHGRFSSVDTHQTGLALAAYSVGLAAYSGVKVLVPAFYAFGNARVPVISSILSVGLTLAFNLVSVRFLGFWGLALGTSVAAYGNLVFLIVSLRRRAREVLPDQRELWSLRRLGARFGVHGALALTMGALCAFTQQGLSRLFSENLHFSGVFGQSLSISVLALEGLGVLLLLSWVFGVEETREVLGLVRSRILNRIQKKRS